jgi:hypothetical protein
MLVAVQHIRTAAAAFVCSGLQGAYALTVAFIISSIAVTARIAVDHL